MARSNQPREIIIPTLILAAIVVLFIGVSDGSYRRSESTTNERDHVEPVINVKQLEDGEGSIPVEIISPEVQFATASKITRISFGVRNNSDKEVRSFCLAYAVNVETKGKRNRDTFYYTIETLVHPHIRKSSGAFAPISTGISRTVSDDSLLGFDGESKILSLDVWLDFVEFEDGASYGPNIRGERLISGIRGGANNYVFWLKNQYVMNPTIVESFASLLFLDDFPDSVNTSSSQERYGASIYRNQLRRIYRDGGLEGLTDFMRKYVLLDQKN
ncbi:MAG TPA: hypothetical protein PKD24_09470 [Pyrinomonadaceae bacterium]|nr:hypothetical protein [Pyrinomonadaceae bacterium]HMP65702.1 hypothetical protein [Pyrinomonadaceae bacterium]